jgi:hypothetical protein
MQCKCKTQSGRRCRNKTVKFLPCCWVHADDAPVVDHDLVDGLYVANSNVSRAGRGLFTEYRIRTGDRVGFYEGRRVSHDARGSYVMSCGRGRARVTIDAQDKHLVESSALRYANTWTNRSSVKASFTRRTGRRKLRNNLRITRGGGSRQGCAVFATTNIPAGSELLLSYGRSFNV